MAESSRPHCIVLIGKPAVGKSTLAQEYADKGYAVLSGDEAIEHIQHKYQYPTVEGVYAKHKEEANEYLLQKRTDILEHGKNMVLDFLNLTEEKRSRNLDAVRSSQYDYMLEAVVVHPPEHVEYMRRLAQRDADGKPTGTSLSEQMQMDKEYEAPTEAEGFEVIRTIGEPQKSRMIP